MASSEESSLTSLLQEELRGIEGLSEDARSADVRITTYLRQKFADLFSSEYKRRHATAEGERAVTYRAARVLDELVLDARTLYTLFERQLVDGLDEFWEGLDLDEAPGVQDIEDRSDPRETTDWFGPGGTPVSGSSLGVREPRFRCLEGCEFEGDGAYLAHRDRGHHPIPG